MERNEGEKERKWEEKKERKKKRDKESIIVEASHGPMLSRTKSGV